MPGWSGPHALWISRRREGRLLWTEVDADSGKETGRTTPGSHDCADGSPDPMSPVDLDLRLVLEQKSEVRFIPSQLLPAL
jgi:hypothetical protein